MEIEIRPCAEEDATAVAELIYSAGMGHTEVSVYDLMLPGPPGPTRERLGVIRRMLTAETLNWLNHRFYRVACVGGAVAAALCTFDKDESRGRHLVEGFKEVGWSDGDLAAMAERMQPVFRVEPNIPEEAWIIENVAAFPEFRGLGIVTALLEDAVEEGERRGMTQMQISTFIGNERARRAYEKVGFRVSEEKTDLEFEDIFGTPGMYRMSMQVYRPT